jgi:hypothetical protein
MKKPIAAALMVAFFSPVHAETTDQLVYDNPEYSIVLTVAPCKIDKKHHPFGKDFAYEATAFDKTSLGHACWYKEDGIVHVWFWEETKIYIGSYSDHLFKPVKPEL